VAVRIVDYDIQQHFADGATDDGVRGLAESRSDQQKNGSQLAHAHSRPDIDAHT
jgi:hypothetical protein